MSTEQRWAKVWLLWIAYFGVAEYFALRSKDRKAPLSFHLRKALGIRRRPWHQRTGQVALGAGTIWLFVHLYRELEERLEP